MGVFHSGELEAQRRAGVEDLAGRVGRIIDSTISAAAAHFLVQRPFVVTSTSRSDGRVHASILTGPPGFAQAVDPSTITLRPRGGDLAVVRDDIRAPGTLGLLAIDFATRRRVRMNGMAVVSGEEIRLTTREVYANCPQYIHAHEDVTLSPSLVTSATGLDERQRALIASADTFFIASLHPERGADASHRGGEPGFITTTPSSVSWLDYPGNNMFNTLGNLLVNDRCSLLFVDFARNGSLRIDGRASIEWGDPRRIDVTIDEVVEQRPSVRF